MPVLKDRWDPELPDTETAYKPSLAAIAERDGLGGERVRKISRGIKEGLQAF